MASGFSSSLKGPKVAVELSWRRSTCSVAARVGVSCSRASLAVSLRFALSASCRNVVIYRSGLILLPLREPAAVDGHVGVGWSGHSFCTS